MRSHLARRLPDLFLSDDNIPTEGDSRLRKGGNADESKRNPSEKISYSRIIEAEGLFFLEFYEQIWHILPFDLMARSHGTVGRAPKVQLKGFSPSQKRRHGELSHFLEHPFDYTEILIPNTTHLPVHHGLPSNADHHPYVLFKNKYSQCCWVRIANSKPSSIVLAVF